VPVAGGVLARQLVENRTESSLSALMQGGIMQGSHAVEPVAKGDRSPGPALHLVAAEEDNGLEPGALGLISSVVIGVASTAPAYSLAATLGFVVAVAGIGFKSPAVMIVSFVPMLLIAGSYYYLNRVDPDCGTTFTWVTRAFGPRTGWVTGWIMVAADVIVMASLAQIAGSYFFLLFGAAGLAASTFWTTLAGTVFIAAMTLIAALGIDISARVQWGLLAAEVLILVVFSVTALIKVYGGSPPAGSVRPAASWFVPNMSLGALAGGVLLALFIYWGWDTTVSVNEETQRKSIVPGVGAVLSTVALVAIYVLTTTAAQAFHGPQFLANNADDVLSPLGTAVFGSATLDKLLILAVLTSSVASTLTTILPATRTTLSMAVHGAIPKAFARVSPRLRTPLFGTIIYGVVSTVWYVGLTALSQNVLYDSIAALGLMIAFYLGISGYAVPVFYRHQIFGSVKKFLLLGLFPLLGGLSLTWVLFASLDSLWYPANSESGTSWFGIGPPFIIGMAFLVAGIVLMLVAAASYKGFFSRRRETVETMTATPEETQIDPEAARIEPPSAA
jgi:amino acid transporter